ncbi:hypothetical protein JUN65_00525 [Gluconacetobacter azotocaptans]|nr:hypothetical protein [Gluconacetobacter azotocaptans]
MILPPYGRKILMRAMSLVVLASGAMMHAPPPAQGRSLRIEAESRAKGWNAVVRADGHIFVAGPRWLGFGGPAVGELDARGEIRPFPDAAWNGWKPGRDAARRFVSVNALHLDPEGKIWIVDTGTPAFGAPPVRGGAKLIRIDPTTGEVLRCLPLGPDIAPAGSYIDDIRFNRRHAYLSDAGRGALLVLDLGTGQFRRVLAGVPATMAQAARPIVVDGRILQNGAGAPLLVNADPLEVSPDGKWLYFGPLEGPWSKLPTGLLDNPATSPEQLAAAVRPWADLPAIGGSAMDKEGNLYFTVLNDDSLYRRDASGTIVRMLSDPRLHWADAPFLAQDGRLWLPVAQLDRVARFHDGQSHIRLPFLLFSVSTEAPRATDAAGAKTVSVP